MIVHYHFQGHSFPMAFQNPYLARILWRVMVDEHLLFVSLFLSLAVVPLSYYVSSGDKRAGERVILLGMALSAIPLLASPLMPLLYRGRVILIVRIALSHDATFNRVLLYRIGYSIAHWSRWDPEAWLIGAALLMLVIPFLASSSMRGKRHLPAPAWLQREVEKLSSLAGIRAPEVMLIDSGVPNAYASISLLNKRVMITVGLLETLNRRELRAVLAHEISHLSHRDPLKRLVGRYFRIVMLANPLTHLLEPWLSRSEEYAADREAALLTSPADMISALLKLSGVIAASESMAPAVPLPAFLGGSSILRILSGHPSSAERIKNLMAMLEEK